MPCKPGDPSPPHWLPSDPCEPLTHFCQASRVPHAHTEPPHSKLEEPPLRALREEPCPQPKLGEAPGHPHSPRGPPPPTHLCLEEAPSHGGASCPSSWQAPRVGIPSSATTTPLAHLPAAARSPALQINAASYQPCPCLRAPAQGGPWSGGPSPPPPLVQRATWLSARLAPGPCQPPLPCTKGSLASHLSAGPQAPRVLRCPPPSLPGRLLAGASPACLSCQACYSCSIPSPLSLFFLSSAGGGSE